MNVPSPAMPTLKTVPDNPTNDSYTDRDEVITYSTLKELCTQLSEFREGLPTGGWDQPQEKDNEL